MPGIPSTRPASDEAKVRELLERWVSAVHAQDLETVLSDRTDDIWMFDVPPPEDGVRGTAAYHEVWPPFLEFQRSGALFELVELQVTAGPDVAWAAALLRCGMPEELDREPDRRLRLTFGLRKVDGRWLVGHEHQSFTLA